MTETLTDIAEDFILTLAKMEYPSEKVAAGNRLIASLMRTSLETIVKLVADTATDGEILTVTEEIISEFATDTLQAYTVIAKALEGETDV
jgi:hypothetical protein